MRRPDTTDPETPRIGLGPSAGDPWPVRRRARPIRPPSERELTAQEAARRLGRLPDWRLEFGGRRLVCTFHLRSVAEALYLAGFVAVAPSFEATGTTVEISGRRVRVQAGGRTTDRVSDLAFSLAESIDETARALGATPT